MAACEGALAAGATQIVVRDAHGSGRNILQEQLPKQAQLIRGWSGHPFAMVQELDSSFDAVCMVGYHGPASHPNNPLSHTNTTRWNKITLNGLDLPEYLSHAHCAALEGVPVVFLSGDTGICEIARSTNPQIHTCACPPPTTSLVAPLVTPARRSAPERRLRSVETNRGHGESVIATIHPETARERIAAGVQAALESDLTAHVQPKSASYELVRCLIPPPRQPACLRLREHCRKVHEPMLVQRVRYVKHGDAYKTSWYPGAALEDSQTVVYRSDSYWDVATFMRFL